MVGENQIQYISHALNSYNDSLERGNHIEGQFFFPQYQNSSLDG